MAKRKSSHLTFNQRVSLAELMKSLSNRANNTMRKTDEEVVEIAKEKLDLVVTTNNVKRLRVDLSLKAPARVAGRRNGPKYAKRIKRIEEFIESQWPELWADQS